jgi:hypothetical protein
LEPVPLRRGTKGGTHHRAARSQTRIEPHHPWSHHLLAHQPWSPIVLLPGPKKTKWSIFTSIWAPRAKCCDAGDFWDTPPTKRRMFEHEFALSLQKHALEKKLELACRRIPSHEGMDHTAHALRDALFRHFELLWGQRHASDPADPLPSHLISSGFPSRLIASRLVSSHLVASHRVTSRLVTSRLIASHSSHPIPSVLIPSQACSTTTPPSALAISSPSQGRASRRWSPSVRWLTRSRWASASLT